MKPKGPRPKLKPYRGKALKQKAKLKKRKLPASSDKLDTSAYS